MPKRTIKRWTKEEDLFLKKSIGYKELKDVAKELGRTPSSVRQRMERLGFVKKVTPRNIPWTLEQDEYLIENFHCKSITQIAKDLGRTTSSVKNRRLKLDIPLKREVRPWTEEEDQVIQDSYGTSSLITMAKRLNRTEDAIQKRLEHLGLSNVLTHSRYINISKLAECCGVDRKTITRWIEKFKLKSMKRVLVRSRKYRLISIDDFWSWAESNTKIVNLHKIQRSTLLPEPDWLDKYLRDNPSTNLKDHALWTDAEDETLYRLYYIEKNTQRQVGEKLGRSRRSIQYRLTHKYKNK